MLNAFRELISKIEAITPKTKEVRSLNETYIASLNKQYSTMIEIMAALEQQDTNIISLANDKLAEETDFQSNSQDLTDKHNVKITELN